MGEGGWAKISDRDIVYLGTFFYSFPYSIILLWYLDTQFMMPPFTEYFQKQDNDYEDYPLNNYMYLHR